MYFYVSDDFGLPLPEGHRFPREKYKMLHDTLMVEDIVPAALFRESPHAERHDLIRVHSEIYVDQLTDGSIDPKIMRQIGFPWSPAIPRRGEKTVGGAIAAAFAALGNGLSGQLAGGTHHARHEHGAGFCIYNDLAAVASKLIDESHVSRVAIIDLDVHQGDGNAEILAGREDVFILDLFGEKNFPFRKVPSTLDVPLPDECDDALFLEKLEEHLPAVWAFHPDIILYQAGVDALASDKLGRLSLSFDGLRTRDEIVLRECYRLGIPCSMAIGGGYANPISDTVHAYANTYRVAKSIFRF